MSRCTYRDGGKVRHQTLGNLSCLPGEVIELVEASPIPLTLQ
jgi:hypothetical protein